MEKSDFKIGQKIFLKIVENSNAARCIDKSNPEAWIKEKIVINIGKKYLTVADNIDNTFGEVKFIIKNNFPQYYTVGANYELYLSKEDILEDIICEKIYSEIKDAFHDWKIIKSIHSNSCRV